MIGLVAQCCYFVSTSDVENIIVGTMFYVTILTKSVTDILSISIVKISESRITRVQFTGRE